jgi:DNA-binding NtrC family response regulator
MTAISCLLVHPEARFRTEAGRRLRRESFPAFLAADAAEALELLAEHPAIAVVAAPAGSAGAEVLARIRSRRPSLATLALGEQETADPAGEGLARLVREAVEARRTERDLRLGSLIHERMRRRLRRLAARLDEERLARFGAAVSGAGGGRS